MSKESITWLNQNILIGRTDQRGHAWHYKAAAQGDESNHYPGFIPVPDVERRLFAFDPVERPAATLRPYVVGEGNPLALVEIEGVRYEVIIDSEHKAICDPDHGVVFNYPTSDYQIHNYRQWLLNNVATILDADLGISSAGLLRRRAQAWVEVSVPENIETPEGVTFRPNLLVFTSLDATLATTYKRTIGEVVCDNTLQARIGEEGETFRIRHTANSLGRVTEARQALNIIYSAADDFAAEVAELCRVEVTEKEWQSVLSALVPTEGKEPGRSLTIAENKKGKLNQLYHFDPRCAPWEGTKFGVIQTANTYNLHEATVRNTHGGGRVERNQLKIISGQAARVDNYVAEVVDLVLAAS
jgi:phage/plasmid-like protein (TIGR03299 family)